MSDKTLREKLRTICAGENHYIDLSYEQVDELVEELARFVTQERKAAKEEVLARLWGRMAEGDLGVLPVVLNN